MQSKNRTNGTLKHMIITAMCKMLGHWYTFFFAVELGYHGNLRSADFSAYLASCAIFCLAFLDINIFMYFQL
jgi:hypothetical protein